MKSICRVIAVLLFSVFALSSCKQTTIVKTKTPPPGQVKKTGKPLPPGQAKKVTGSKSAAPYAPGQQNKSTNKSSKAKEDKGKEKKK